MSDANPEELGSSGGESQVVEPCVTVSSESEPCVTARVESGETLCDGFERE